MVAFIKKNWFWVIPVFVAVVASLYLWAQKRRAENKNILPSISSLNKDVVLYNGIDGYEKEVIELQKYLNKNGASLSVDGAFGQKTAEALYLQKGVWQIKLSEL